MNSAVRMGIAVCCAIAALVLVRGLWRSDEAPDDVAVRESRGRAGEPRAADERKPGGALGSSHRGAARSGDTHTRDASPDNASRHDEHARRNHNLPMRSQPRAATGGGQRGAGIRGEGGGAPPSDRWGLPPAPPRMEPELPPADDEHAAGEDETADEAVESPSDVAYDGGGDHVFNTATQVEVTDAGRIEGGAGTIAFWIDPGWEAFTQDNASFVRIGENGLEVSKFGNHLRFRYLDGNGNEYGGDTDIGEWEPGEWRHVTATWMGGRLSLYVDGGQVFLNHGPSPPTQVEPKLYVGTAASTSGVAPAQLSYLTVLNREATVDEVKQMFDSGRAPTQ